MTLHTINIGPKGTFQISGDRHTTPQDIDTIFEDIAQSGKTKLTIYFHGGLIKESAGYAIADKMNSLYADAGAYPVSFVWETGLLETITRNLTTIHDTALFKKLLSYALKFASEKLGAAAGKGPGETVPFAEIDRQLESDILFAEFDEGARGASALYTESEADEIEPDLQERIDEEISMDPEFQTLLSTPAPPDPLLDQGLLDTVQEEQSKGIMGWASVARILAKVVVSVIKRYINKRDHGFYPTVMEEILREVYLAKFGEWVWGGMKTAAANMWKPNQGLSGFDQHAGTRFVEKLQEFVRNKPDITVDLIGHSAGSIAICQMLKAAGGGIPCIRNILFLAPACTCELFASEIVQQPDRFKHFRMYTMRDDYEGRDILLPGIYTRSLLYFISGVLENEADMPILGMHRYLTGEPPFSTPLLTQVRSFLTEKQGRLILSDSTALTPDAEPGCRSCSLTHGGFDDDPVTRSSLQYIISQV